MVRSKRLLHQVAWVTAGALVVAVLVAAAPAAAVPNMETHAYYSVVKDVAYAPYTEADALQRTSLIAYYSVVKDVAYAPYTEADAFKRTSLLPYYSVLH